MMTLDAIADGVAAFLPAGASVVEAISNRTYLCESSAEYFVVKTWPRHVGAHVIDARLAVQDYLARHSEPSICPRPLAARDGRLFAALDAVPYFASMYAVVVGEAVEIPTQEVFRSAGALLGRWRNVCTSAPSWLTKRLPSRSAGMLIHGDFHFGNLVQRHDRVVSVIDMDDLCIGSPADDLAALLVFEQAHRHVGHLKALVDSYFATALNPAVDTCSLEVVSAIWRRVHALGVGSPGLCRIESVASWCVDESQGLDRWFEMLPAATDD